MSRKSIGKVLRVAVRIGYVLLIILIFWWIFPALKKAKSFSGPTPGAQIRDNLYEIAQAKLILKETQYRPDDYWPTRAEIAWASRGSSNASFDAVFKRTRWGEVYIVNQIGAPAYAYFSNAVQSFPEGSLLTAEDFERLRNPGYSTNKNKPAHIKTNQISPTSDFHP